jgi:phosphoribosylaminoimidazole-succinocarboxamide synthase
LRIYLTTAVYHGITVKDICGAELAAKIEKVALQLYSMFCLRDLLVCTTLTCTSRYTAEAADYALTRGIILADTKFEFGLLPSSSSSEKTLILIDEVLTPDSSRYWSADTYAVGKSQDSFDKQFVRDWLIKEGKKNVEGVTLPENVVKGTAAKYQEAVERLMG